MTRVIKFRAYDPSKNYMTKGKTLKRSCETARDLKDWYWDDSIIMMQFTGLTDKNGKDIYEGDILKRGKGISFIVWCLDSWRFNSWMPDGMNLYSAVDKTRGDKYEIAEIIGNIYENPELLK